MCTTLGHRERSRSSEVDFACCATIPGVQPDSSAAACGFALERPLTCIGGIGPLGMNLGRSYLTLGALEPLEEAWDVALEMAPVHPTSQEGMRVLTSLHRRSNPRLTRLARRAGVTLRGQTTGGVNDQ
ncbi:hypothetical protein [Streptomyces mirabilis]|uniref:hypothetical protein n=1 Tax=Streptomyces mirabilis TaxID=68239 RepID=UPI002E2ADB83|nr:hypothetical protein [Streptomyces mirabilis]